MKALLSIPAEELPHSGSLPIRGLKEHRKWFGIWGQLSLKNMGVHMYKSIDDLPVTFGPAEVAKILGISRNKAYDLVNRLDFPKYRVGRKIVISKKHFIKWMDEKFSDTNIGSF